MSDGDPRRFLSYGDIFICTRLDKTMTFWCPRTICFSPFQTWGFLGGFKNTQKSSRCWVGLSRIIEMAWIGRSPSKHRDDSSEAHPTLRWFECVREALKKRRVTELLRGFTVESSAYMLKSGTWEFLGENPILVIGARRILWALKPRF
jgi:hypothetical protein